MNTFTMTNRLAARFVAVLAVFSLLMSLVPMQALAVANDHQIRICHATGGDTYSAPSPTKSQIYGDIEAVDGPNAHGSLVAGVHPSDIIPPFGAGSQGDNTWGEYPGKNWDAEGQAIWNNNCEALVAQTDVDLSVTKKASDEKPDATQSVVYTIVVANAGPATATNVVLTDNVPAGTTFVSANPAQTGSGPYTWNLGTIASGDSKTVTVTVNVDANASGKITNTASVVGSETDSDTDNNSVSEDINVNALPPRTCAEPTAINIGQPLPCLYPTTGTIVVDKVTVPSADSQSFAFTTTGAGYVGFNLMDTSAVNSQTVEAGQYSVTETSVAGWTQTNVACVSSIQDVEVASALELDANETITCTFTNTKDGIPTIPGCTNVAATNYNSLATVDDQSCEFDYQSVCVSPNTNFLENGSFEAPVVTANGGTYEIFANVANWAISLSDGLELWKGIVTPSDGLQNVELDGNDATRITQEVSGLEIGATYELRFDFAARTADKADNNVNAMIDGSVVENANSANTNWTTYGTTFVATDTSVEVGFEDIGTAQDNGGTGSLLDNAVLCLVDEPAPVEACELTVVSDITNTVNQSGALVLTNLPESWVDGIAESVAQWIWGSAPGSAIDPVIDETQTFVKTFNWNGPVTAATLQLTSDNAYSVKLNGTVVGGDATPTNFQSVDTIVDIADNVIQGTNTLEISVTNLANGATVLEGNPAGLIYDLNIVGNATDDCKVVPDDGGGNEEDELSCELTASDTSIRRGSDVTLSWDIVGDFFSAVLTNSSNDDEVEIESVEGSRDEEDIDEDTTYTLTLLGDYLEDQNEEGAREEVTCEVTIDTRSGGSNGGGTRVDRDGRVAGDSTTKPEGQVLGDQVSVVPLGAAAAGAGGAAPVELPGLGLTAAAFLARRK